VSVSGGRQTKAVVRYLWLIGTFLGDFGNWNIRVNAGGGGRNTNTSHSESLDLEGVIAKFLS